MLKLYQYQVLAGFLLALAASGAIRTLSVGGLQASFEAASFLLCCAGVLTGGRAVRLRFEELSRNKSMALRDPNYMRMRLQLQLTALVAVAAIGMLVAHRYSMPWFLPLAAAVVLAVCLPLMNRFTGWTRLKDRQANV